MTLTAAVVVFGNVNVKTDVSSDVLNVLLVTTLTVTAAMSLPGTCLAGFDHRSRHTSTTGNRWGSQATWKRHRRRMSRSRKHDMTTEANQQRQGSPATIEGGPLTLILSNICSVKSEKNTSSSTMTDTDSADEKEKHPSLRDNEEQCQQKWKSEYKELALYCDLRCDICSSFV